MLRRLKVWLTSVRDSWKETFYRRYIIAQEARNPDKSYRDITADVVREERRETLQDRLNNNGD